VTRQGRERLTPFPSRPIENVFRLSESGRQGRRGAGGGGSDAWTEQQHAAGDAAV